MRNPNCDKVTANVVVAADGVGSASWALTVGKKRYSGK